MGIVFSYGPSMTLPHRGIISLSTFIDDPVMEMRDTEEKVRVIGIDTTVAVHRLKADISNKWFTLNRFHPVLGR